MNAYKAYESGEIEEILAFNENSLRKLLADSIASLGSDYFCFGLQRSNKDFVEIHPVGKSQFIFRSDRLCKSGSFWQRLTQSGTIERKVESEEEVLSILNTYMHHTREEFESKYA